MGGADAVLCASIFHYGRYTVREAKQQPGGGRDPGTRLSAAWRMCAWLRRPRDDLPARLERAAGHGPPAAAPWTGWRLPTWWAGRCATCCAARPRSTSTWRWRATRWRSRASWPSAWAARPRCTTASAPPPCAPTTWPWTWPRTRRERYQRPGALPEVEPAGLDEDLRRRDFTVNAMALGPRRATGSGALHDPHGRRGRPRRRRPAGPPRAQLPRRPHPAPARAALRGAAGIRAGPRDRAAGAGGGRGRRTRHGLGRRACATS